MPPTTRRLPLPLWAQRTLRALTAAQMLGALLGVIALAMASSGLH